MRGGAFLGVLHGKHLLLQVVKKGDTDLTVRRRVSVRTRLAVTPCLERATVPRAGWVPPAPSPAPGVRMASTAPDPVSVWTGGRATLSPASVSVNLDTQGSSARKVNYNKQSVRGPTLDVRIWRLKSIPALKEWTYLYWSQTHNTGIQMKRYELTKTFRWFSGEKTPTVSMVCKKIFKCSKS